MGIRDNCQIERVQKTIENAWSTEHIIKTVKCNEDSHPDQYQSIMQYLRIPFCSSSIPQIH
jgi:hypothetical protein